MLSLDSRVSLQHSLALRPVRESREIVALQETHRALWGANVILGKTNATSVPEKGAILVLRLLCDLQTMCHEALVAVANVPYEPRIHG